MEGVGIVGISGDVELASVDRSEPVLAPVQLAREKRVELAQQESKGGQKKLAPLLNKRGGGGGAMLEIEILEKLVPDRAALHGDKKTQQIPEVKFSFSRKIGIRVFGELAWALGHFVDD